MGVTVLDGSCGLPAIEQDKVAFEGLLTYESRGGVWKERWFVLDSNRFALVKCATSSRQRSRSYNSVLGGDVLIKDVQPLRRLSLDTHAPNDAPNNSSSNSSSTGLAVTTQSGAQLRFRTQSIDDETQWLAAVAKLSSGFTAGVGARLAERELLAGKFSLVRELGRGASGIVSLYTWQGKPFAIKKFVPQKAKGMPNRRVAVPGAGQLEPSGAQPAPVSSNTAIPDDIRREIALLKKASHLPYVIQLYDVILDPEHGQYYLVMEYMGGGAIAEWDAERKCYVSAKQTKSMSLLDEATVRRYTTHLLLGIQALHRNRLCHRDIKPENLIATDDRATCKIGDLGVAHYFREDANGELCEEDDVQAIELWDIDSADAATRTVVNSTDNTVDRRRGMLKSTKGTYQFLPPEALSGDAFCGFKADVWSIGVTLYALSFGYLPFYSNDLVQLFEKIERDAVVFPLHCQDDALKDLLGAILEKDPAKRITVDAILAHPWLHRNVNTKALQSQVRALKRSGSLTVADHDVGAAVSVLQRRFDAMSLALRGDSLNDVADAARPSPHAATTAGAGVVQYMPRPIVSDHAELPKWLMRDTTLLAAQLHYDWCRTKYLDGWRHGTERDNAARVHPCLLPMRELPDDEQAKNVRCVIETMRCVVALGCRLSPPKERRAVEHELLWTDNVTLSWEMLLLIDLLAENSHEVWADGYVQAGWTHGDSFDATRKRHPSLKPYMALDEHEKDLSREAVSSVLRACICLGYGIACSRRQIEC